MLKKPHENLFRAYINARSQRWIDNFPGDWVQDISIFQSQCANMTFADKIINDRMFQQVVYKVGDSEIKFTKRFQNAKALEISVVNSYTEDHLMHTLLETFQQGGKYYSRIILHQTELRREEKSWIKNHYLHLSYKSIMWIWKIQ